MPDEPLPDELETANSELGIIKFEDNIESVSCDLKDDKSPDRCLVQSSNDDGIVTGEDNFVVSPDYVHTYGLTQFPETVVSYSSPNYSYEDPPDDIVSLGSEADNMNCVVAKVSGEETTMNDVGDIALACYPDGYPLETIDSGVTDEIFEDAREMGIL